MSIGFRQSMRGSMFRSLRDLGADGDDYQQPPPPSGPTLADIQAIVNAQSFGGIWIVQNNAYVNGGTTLAIDGQTVQQISDLSSFANHLVQASSGARPTFRASADNGLPAIETTGTNNNLTVAADMPGLAYPFYRIIAWKAVSHAIGYGIVAGDKFTANSCLLQHQAGTDNYGIFDGVYLGLTQIADGTLVVTTEMHTGVNGTAKFQIDKGTVTTGNAGINAVGKGLRLFSTSAADAPDVGTRFQGCVYVPGSAAASIPTIQTWLASLQGRSI